MYSIRQFKPVLYALLLLSMTGYGLAAQSPAVWLVGFGGVSLNAWLVYRGQFRPIPRLIANLITIGGFLFVARQLMGAGQAAVLIIAQFLVVLQVIKLWEQRANRDYAQLLIISLLLMVAAAISTSSLLFGVLLIAYLLLALYCCLLFHLKVESDAAKASLALPEELVGEERLRQDQRFLTRSMRRLTGIIAGVGVGMAVLVFLFFPRGAGKNMITPMAFRTSQALTGFTEESSLDQVASITQNDAIVAHVELFKNGRRVETPLTLYLRGITLDRYVAEEGRASSWKRTAGDTAARTLNAGLETRLAEPPAPDENGRGPATWRQKVQLEPTGTRAIFALAGAHQLTAGRALTMRVGNDGSLLSTDPLVTPMEYEVVSSDTIPGGPVRRSGADSRAFEPGDRTFDPAIVAYARRPEVSGADANGPFVERREAQRRERDAREGRADAAASGASLNAEAERILNFVRSGPPHAGRKPLRDLTLPIDAEIAASIERHFKGPEYSYTLDLTNAVNRAGRDPIAWFLSADGKRGHCEYYANAMVLLCQSLGLESRVVHGFKSDEYNPYSQRHIVRQAHAHAWVEVLTAEGWRRYDPTSGRESQVASRSSGFLQKAKHFFNFLEFTYANNVIAYDNESRESLIQSVENKMNAPLYAAMNQGRWSSQPFQSQAIQQFAGSAVGVVVMLIAAAVIGFGAWAIWRRLLLRRRAGRIGIQNLPTEERLRLAKQLGFYEDLIVLLGKHKIERSPHQTPLEFSRSLMYLPADAYEAIRRLTGIFYRVRFGRAELDADKQRRLGKAIARVEAALGTPESRGAR